MKITKSQLKQIIKEELQAVLGEDAFDDMDTALEKTKAPPAERPKLPPTMKDTDVVKFDKKDVQVKDLSDKKLQTLVDLEDFEQSPGKGPTLKRK